jgi:hypothetical protein
MRRGPGALLAVVATAAACVLIERDPTEIKPDPPDATVPPPIGGGGGDGPINFGDGGPPIPGSGEDGDNGTAVLALVRVDQGTANLADSIQALLGLIVDRFKPEGLKVTSVTVADLYRKQPLWASRPEATPPPLSSVLRGAAAAAATSGIPSSPCATAALQSAGPELRAWLVNGVRPFVPTPGAILILLIDSGGRPSAMGGCTAAKDWTADPVQWAWPMHVGRTHFAFLATPENGDLSALRAHCIGVSGFPTSALDVLAPSANAYFDPLSVQMNGLVPGLVHRADLCDALGSGASGFWSDVAARWVPLLAASR